MYGTIVVEQTFTLLWTTSYSIMRSYSVENFSLRATHIVITCRPTPILPVRLVREFIHVHIRTFHLATCIRARYMYCFDVTASIALVSLSSPAGGCHTQHGPWCVHVQQSVFLFPFSYAQSPGTWRPPHATVTRSSDSAQSVADKRTHTRMFTVYNL